MSFRHRIIQAREWEYWPGWTYYGPLIPMFLWHALRNGHPCYFTGVNPAIYTGGFGMEAKYPGIMMIPEAWRPKTTLIPAKSSADSIREKISAAGIRYPLIAKPDIGARGFLVAKHLDEASLLAYLQAHETDFLLQDFIPWTEEVGVFYHRLPGEKKGQITSLTRKEFLHVIGDGERTVRALIEAHPRALMQLDRLEKEQALLASVPAKGAYVSLGEIGNHAKGTRFINANDQITARLVATFDGIADALPGVCYGRFDIRCRSLAHLERGEDFAIIEINGACSEPAHIYDAEKGSYFGAVREIARHWRILRRIAAKNRANGHAYLPFGEMMGVIRRYYKQLAEWG